MTESDYMSEACEEVVAFAKSDQERPSSRMVTAVNAIYPAIDPNEGQSTVECAVVWCTIAAQRLVIDLIRNLSTAELKKVENGLNEIAGTFASVRRAGGEWRAFVARDGQTADRVVDDQTAKDFLQGRHSMGDLIDKLYSGGIPSPRKNEEHEVRQTKGRRK